MRRPRRRQAPADPGFLLRRLAPFLAQRFSQVHLVDLRYYRLPLAQYVADNDIDEICVVYSAQNFLTDRDLVMLTQ